MACFSASTLEVCPIPQPISCLFFSQHDGIGFQVLYDFVGKKRSVRFPAAVGRFSVTH